MRHRVRVLVDLEQHDQQLTPDTRGKRATDHDQQSGGKAGERHPAKCKHRADAAQDGGQQQQLVHKRNDLRRDHRIEEQQGFHG